MNILSVYAHEEASSLTATLKNTSLRVLANQGHQVVENDLNAIGFEPKASKVDFNSLTGNHFNYMLEQQHAAKNGMAFAPDISFEMEKLKAADLLLIHAPLWWHSVPAVLKGWFDRVFAMGFAWDGGLFYEKGLLRGKSALLCMPTGAPKDFYSPDGPHKATIEQILHPILHGTLAYCGMDVFEPFIVFNSVALDENSANKVLQEYQFRIEHLFDSPNYLYRFD